LSWNLELQQKALDILRDSYAGVRTELRAADAFQLLVAVVLSAQTTDRQVNSVTAELFRQVSSPQELAALSQEELENLIKGVGLFRSKAKHLREMARLLVERHQGLVPQSLAELEALPGVGHKTASVVVAEAFDIPALAVDTHVFRVANRLGLATASTVTLVEQQLKELIPEEEWTQAHHWLIHHGRNHCRARNPICPECPAAACCRANLQA